MTSEEAMRGLLRMTASGRPTDRFDLRVARIYHQRILFDRPDQASADVAARLMADISRRASLVDAMRAPETQGQQTSDGATPTR